MLLFFEIESGSPSFSPEAIGSYIPDYCGWQRFLN
jgi:hypothetical protein